MMRTRRRLDRIDGDANVAVSTVLEADRTRQPGRQFAVNLRFRGTGADGAPGDEVGDVLRRDHVEEFSARWQPHFIQFPQQLARQAQAFVDGEAAVQVRIVDQPLPAHRGTRLLEIDAHHDHQIGGEALALGLQAHGIFHRRLGIMNRTGADDDDQAVVGAMQYAMNGLPRFPGGLCGSFGFRQFAQQMRRGGQFLDFPDAKIVDNVFHEKGIGLI